MFNCCSIKNKKIFGFDFFISFGCYNYNYRDDKKIKLSGLLLIITHRHWLCNNESAYSVNEVCMLAAVSSNKSFNLLRYQIITTTIIKWTNTKHDLN